MSNGEFDSAPPFRPIPSEEFDILSETTGSQSALFRRLEMKDNEYVSKTSEELQPHQKLSIMYLGALYALKHTKNQYRLSQAAHAFRELIDKLLKRHVSGGKGGPDFQKLKVAFQDTATKLEICSNQDEKLNALSEFFKTAKEVYTHNEYQVLIKREKAQRVFEDHKIDGSKIPQPLLDHKVAELINVHDKYFLGVTHGGKTSYEEFVGYLEGFENCLLGMFNLRFGDEVLDKLINDAEKGDAHD